MREASRTADNVCGRDEKKWACDLNWTLSEARRRLLVFMPDWYARMRTRMRADTKEMSEHAMI